jgi:hypothetical protein
MWDERAKYILIIGIYVNDFLIICKESNILDLIHEFKKRKFHLKIENNANEYFCCCIEESKDERKLTMI